MRVPTSRLLSLALLAAVGAAPEPMGAQEEVPPTVQGSVLTNGARVLVVTAHDVPLVTVTLVLPGGRTSDPAGRLGVADLTARLLGRGSATRTARQTREDLGRLGATLDASAGTDWTTVSAAATSRHLPELLELMAGAVLRPAFPPRALEQVRGEALSRLRADLERPAVLADRAFLRAVYDGHPYGRLETPATIRAVDRPSVVEFHRTWYVPGGALFVVAGDVEAGRARTLLERSFGGWEPGEPPAPPGGLPTPSHAPRVVLVHRPDADRAVLRVGQTLPRGDHPDWPALLLLDRALGGGPPARALPAAEDRLPGVPLRVGFQRRLDRGFVQVAAEVPAVLAWPVLEELRRQILLLREHPVGIEALRHAREGLAAPDRVRPATPQQVAAGRAAAHLLGGSDPTSPSGRRELAGLDAGHLQAVARRQIRPEGMVVVAVGDAARLRASLAELGEVTVVDADGEPVDVQQLRPPDRPDGLDASRLRPGTARYRVTLAGGVLGTASRTLEAGETAGTMVFRGTARLGPEVLDQSVTFTVPGFEPLAAESTSGAAGAGAFTAVRIRDGRVSGTARSPGEEGRRIEWPLPEGAVLGDMAELVLWLADLDEGSRFSVPVLEVESGEVREVAFAVTGVEEVTVPAGTFRAYRVEMGGRDPQVAWVRVQEPHLPLRLRSLTGPAVLELTSSSLVDGRF